MYQAPLLRDLCGKEGEKILRARGEGCMTPRKQHFPDTTGLRQYELTETMPSCTWPEQVKAIQDPRTEEILIFV